MRLSPEEIKAIIASFKQYFSHSDNLYLFGSRTDDNKRGGDIDLLIETLAPDQNLHFENKIHFITDVKQQIGEQKIDVVMCAKNASDLPIYNHARETGIKLI
jgi:uncharacterized protein